MNEGEDIVVFSDYSDRGVVDLLAEVASDEEVSNVPRLVRRYRTQLDATPTRSLSFQNSSCGSTALSIRA